MRTTTPRSEALARAGVLTLALSLFAGCVGAPTNPQEMMQLQPDSPAHKAMETRIFETHDETELLSASAAVLQDLGFQVTESVHELGFLRAAKERSAREYGQEITRGVVFALSLAATIAGAAGGSGQNAIMLIPVDVQQQIHASLVARPLDAAGTRHEVRVLFYRLVWRGDGQNGDNYIPPGEQRMEMIRDAGIYQTFFARLSKAVFLEAHKI